ncbi:MAG: hypothetical protein OJF62_000975 [Pseudolabrys sp.]|jgi:hypothetical protein|nr:hypothetical protein [Pseudolabrys sp.]
MFTFAVRLPAVLKLMLAAVVRVTQGVLDASADAQEMARAAHRRSPFVDF